MSMPVAVKTQSVTIKMPADLKILPLQADSRKELKKILLGAFAVRIVALLIIFLCTPKWSLSFLEKLPSNNPDDLRYEAIGMDYSKHASSAIDPAAFKIACASHGDWKGYLPWFQDTPLWYWIVCVALYVTRTNITVRLLNIIFACRGIKYLYLLAELLFDKKTALLACKLYAFLPYPVLYCCFAYKDHLLFWGTAYLLYVSFLYRYRRKFSTKSVLPTLFMVFCCASMRSGLTLILILMCLFIAFSKYLNRKKVIFFGCIALALCLLFGRVFVLDSYEALLYKSSIYQSTRQSALNANASISIASISGIRDVYKLPFAFLISVAMPINMSFKIHSWNEIVGMLNLLIMPFVAVGAFLDVILQKHRDVLGQLMCLMYYFACIVTSIGIPRHYYSLLFMPVIMCAHYTSHSPSSYKKLHISLSLAYAVMLLLYLLYKAIFV